MARVWYGLLDLDLGANQFAEIQRLFVGSIRWLFVVGFPAVSGPTVRAWGFVGLGGVLLLSSELIGREVAPVRSSGMRSLNEMIIRLGVTSLGL